MLMIHTADLHLGAIPDAKEVWGKNRKEELWDCFERLITTTEEQQADLLLIAGDLFHRPPLLRELREVNDRFGTLTKTKVVLIAGNHDYIGANSFYRDFQWAENVYFLGSREISSVKLPHLQVEVYGCSYHQRNSDRRIYDAAQPEDNGYYHILLAHGGDEKHCPFSKEKLAKSGFDYIALGHIHKPGMILEERAVMAGSPEPLDHTEEGIHGYVKIEVKEGINRICLVPFASRAYRKLELAVTEQDTAGSLSRRAEAEISKNGREHIYEVLLRGKRHTSLVIPEEKIKSLGNVHTITDLTEPAYDYAALRQTFSGRLLQKYIDSFSATSEMEKRALELGCGAILEVMEL